MAEENKSGLQEAASAANTVRGAVKTGKAIAGAAKGAAAGGPYGAVAGAVWANRKHIGKIVLAAVVILLLPVLFILMLPALLFGGLTNAFSPGNPEVPIFNDNAAITENVNEISFAVNSILAEGMRSTSAWTGTARIIPSSLTRARAIQWNSFKRPPAVKPGGVYQTMSKNTIQKATLTSGVLE